MSKLENLMKITESVYCDYHNHESDNSFLMYIDEPSELINYLKDRKMEIIGISFSMYFKPREDCIAIVFENENFEQFWCHLTKFSWEILLIKIYGEEKVKKYLDELIKNGYSV